MSRAIFIFLLVFIADLAYCQDWKRAYDGAVSAYQKQQYPQALAGAEKAYEASKGMDVKSQAFSLQLLTVICLETPDYPKGLAFAKEEVKLFEQIEGTKGKRYSEALQKRAKFFQALEQWPESKKDYETLLALYADSPGTSSAVYLKTLSNYGQVLLSLNDFSGAANALNNSAAGLKTIPDEVEEYGLALYFGAYAYNKSKDFGSAESRLNEFVLLAEKNGWQSWPEYALAKSQLVEHGGGENDLKAKQYLQLALEAQQTRPLEALGYFKIAEESLSKKSTQTNTGFSVFQNYARCLYSNQQLQASKVKLDIAREIALALYAASSVEFGYVLELDADIQVASGNMPAAAERYQAAFKNFTALPMATQATHHASAAIHFLNANRPDLAKSALEGIALNYVALFALPEKNQLEISSLYTETLIELNQIEDAIKHLTLHASKATTPIAQNTISLNLAEAHEAAGDWKKAEELLESVVRKSMGLLEVHAEAFYQLARLQQQMGKYKEAEKSYLAAVEAHKKIQSTEINQVYNSFATFYTTLGNYEAAEAIYKNLLRDPQTSAALANAVKQNLAAIYQQTLRYDQAEQLLREVLEADRKIIGEKHPDFAISLQNLAALFQAKGNFQQARQLYLQALDVDKMNGGEQTLRYANTEANLGTVYQELGEPGKALQLLESSLKIRERILGKNHPDYMYSLYDLAELKEAMGEYSTAAPLFNQVSHFYLNQIKEIFPSLSDFEKTAYLNKVNKVIDDYEEFVVRFQPNDPAALGQLFNFRLQTKALLLNASVKVRNVILNSGSPEVQTKFIEWLQLKEKLARYSSLTLEEREAQKSLIEESEEKANQLEKWLSFQSELFEGEFARHPITWHDVKKALKPGEGAVEMIRLSLDNDSVIYAALVLKPEQSSPALITFRKSKDMEGREFSYYSNTIRYDLQNERSYALFWEPLDAVLKNSSLVYFSADGIYNKINPLTLYDTRKGQYLVDRLSVRLLSNLSEVTLSPGPLSSTPSASLFGYPDFRSNQPSTAVTVVGHTRNAAIAEIVKSEVAELPGTKEEILNIEQLLKKNQWKVNSYMSREASEEKIKSIQSPDILHIATHGFFIPELEEETPIIYSKDPSLTHSNPLTRSGLLLAGVEKNLIEPSRSANPTEEDGILTALEVMNLTLDHTDMVILSACETGSGKIRNGEGVYGLQRAFLVAGANNLIMSLWKVSDEATEELMIGFYSNFLTSKDKAAAFREAQLELKKKYEAPFYWGAFVLIGR